MTDAVVVQTSRPRPGRRFEPRQELLLHSMALAACESLPNARAGLTVVPEFAGPLGIPDFTAFVGPASALLERQAADVEPILNEVDAGIVSASTTARGRSLSAIAQILAWPETSIARRLPRLLRSGAMRASGTDRYVRHPALSATGRVFAVEAKVEDWTAALRQVRAYRTWADAYVIVTGRLSAGVLERFVPEVQRDLGGLVVDGQWVTRPRVNRVAPHRKLLAFEYLAASTSELVLNGPSLGQAVGT